MTFASGTTYWEALVPGLLIVLLAVTVLPWVNRRNDLARTVAIAVCLFFTWRYMIWRVTDTLPAMGLTADFITGVIFTAVEFAAVFGGSLSLIFLTRTLNRSKEVEANLPWLKAQSEQPLVDVLICTANEDLPILERTIIGALSIDYSNYRLWVCDDGRRPWLQALCEEFGCGYIIRPDNTDAKAGNINNALKHLGTLEETPDFVCILDADFVPKRDLLTRTVALTKVSDVGVVQTPQHFYNPDPIQTNLSLTRVWPDEQRYFFDVVLPSKDAWGGAFCCGTSSLIRYAPLAKIGGMPTDSVTEDYLLSLRLREIGFRTVYLNEILSLGLAPEGLKDYIGQRSRWALGFIQICRSSSGPLRLNNGLPFVDRVMLVETWLHWSASYLCRLLGLIVPALYLLLNVQAIFANVADAVSYVFPHFAAQIAVTIWISRGRLLPILSDLSQVLCADAIVKSVAIGLFGGKQQKFKVTAKGYDRSSRVVQWPLLRAFLFYLGFTFAGILWAFVLNDSRSLADAAGMALFWSWYNILILVLACLVTVEASQRRRGERFKADGMAQVIVGDRGFDYPAHDISVSGMRLNGPMPAPVGTKVKIRYEDLALEAHIAVDYDNAFAVQFATSPGARIALIRHIYCGRFHLHVRDIRPAAVAGALASRLLR
ncbi:glycosyltransferase [Methyloligella sp. 2.7D]|uniref:glycosyltransferase family 2 protein n=1 Tax=unclassified Methyloligella TaxID=2625955 RepID=UPI00157BF593|nr:glycosyltransferase [Methyloligella sp. GL2]QKP76977.1 glycosyltransferase [Methyloligella sp. GL2]